MGEGTAIAFERVNVMMKATQKIKNAQEMTWRISVFMTYFLLELTVWVYVFICNRESAMFFGKHNM